MKRRAALKNILGFGGFGLAGCPGRGFSSAGQIEPGEELAMVAAAEAYLHSVDSPGLSVAIARDGRFVYQQAFGTTGHDL